MPELSSKIQIYCQNNGINSVDFKKDVMLQDLADGKGVFIKEWNLDIAKPTDEQLNALESEATKLENNAKADANRKAEYLSWEEQLDYIYHNGINKWKTDHIKPIKDKYPKE